MMKHLHVWIALWGMVAGIAMDGKAQTTRYYLDESLHKEVAQAKAKVSHTSTRNPDGTMVSEIRDLKKKDVIYREIYKGEEPTGVWIVRKGNALTELDYGFNLTYTLSYCSDTIKGVRDYFSSDAALGYEAPMIDGTGPLSAFISGNLIYPRVARENGVTGTVLLAFTIQPSGAIDRVVVLEGVNPSLDKEAVRVLRMLKLKTPPKINGQTRRLCLTLPVRFLLN